MAGYWKSVRALAWKETLEVVRLDQWARIVLWLTVLGATALTAPSVAEGAVRAGAVVGATLAVGLGIFLVKLVAIPPKLARQSDEQRENALAELRDLKSAAVPARDPDGVYQWGQRVGTAHEVRQELNKGLIIFGTLETDGRFSAEHKFEYRTFKLGYVTSGGGAGISFGSRIGGVERQHSSNELLRNVMCRIIVD
jgi:hypothetical protein